MVAEHLIVTGEPGPAVDRLIACLREDGFEVEFRPRVESIDRLLDVLREVRGEAPIQLEMFK